MKSTLEHLPQSKQEELTLIREAILELGKPVMVILFGSYSRGDWVEDRYIENGTTYEYKSDYDLLIVTARESDTHLGNSKRIKKKIRKSGLVQTPVSLIFHSIEFLNHELEEGNYFFADVVKEGTLLFDSGKFQLAEARLLSAEEKRVKAKEYFEAKGIIIYSSLNIIKDLAVCEACTCPDINTYYFLISKVDLTLALENYLEIASCREELRKEMCEVSGWIFINNSCNC